MNSRRSFLKGAALSAAAAPALMKLDGAAAATGGGKAVPAIDWSMGFPAGSVLLNRNENSMGPSPTAVKVACEGLPRSFRYADPDYLRTIIGKHHDFDRDWIRVGVGSGELLSLAAMLFAKDKNVVSTRESFRGLTSDAAKFGSQIKWVNLIKEKNYAYDVQGLLRAVDGQTGVMFACTPNNPTGAVFTYDELKTLCEGVPKSVLLVIDEAYVHFQGPGRTGVDLLKAGRYPNVMVTRTFSKVYALAGLRSGYGIAHPDIMKKISRFGCGPGSTNMAGFGAVAASLDDQDHIKKSIAFNDRGRAYYLENFKKLNLKVFSGPANFIMVELGPKAAAIAAELERRKIFVRSGEEWDMPNHVRVTFGPDADNQAFFRELPKVL
jgi:histidinol-phosphate aminotransferase